MLEVVQMKTYITDSDIFRLSVLGYILQTESQRMTEFDSINGCFAWRVPRITTAKLWPQIIPGTVGICVMMGDSSYKYGNDPRYAYIKRYYAR